MLINTLSRSQKSLPQFGKNQTSVFNQYFIEFLDELLNQNQSPFTIEQTQESFQLPSISEGQFNRSRINDFEAGKQRVNVKESLHFQSINAEKINKVLGGKLTGLGEVFVRAGQKFNVNPALLAAIAQHETGNGASRAVHEKNNVAGMMGRNGLKSYVSLEESIMDMARNISKNYLGSGVVNIASIGAKYAPIGASNDPTGLNNHWESGVTKYFDNIRV